MPIQAPTFRLASASSMPSKFTRGSRLATWTSRGDIPCAFASPSASPRSGKVVRSRAGCGSWTLGRVRSRPLHECCELWLLDFLEYMLSLSRDRLKRFPRRVSSMRTSRLRTGPMLWIRPTTQSLRCKRSMRCATSDTCRASTSSCDRSSPLAGCWLFVTGRRETAPCFGVNRLYLTVEEQIDALAAAGFADAALDTPSQAWSWSRAASRAEVFGCGRTPNTLALWATMDSGSEWTVRCR